MANIAAFIPVGNLACMDPIVDEFDPGITADQEFGLHLLPNSESPDNFAAVSFKAGHFANASEEIKEILLNADCEGNIIVTLGPSYSFSEAMADLSLQMYDPGIE